MSCVANGSPQPKVKWLRKSNIPLEITVKNETKDFTVVVTVHWNNINRSDTGYYRCEADNGIGESVSSDWAYLNVQCRLLSK